jgi:uncharacterized protein YjbI with pentapeptide repeats
MLAQEMRNLARARTLTVLSRLNGERKASVLEFLYESDLITKDRLVINLAGADLSGANLSLVAADSLSGRLRGRGLTNLSGADLSAANLSGADLSDANLLDAQGVTKEQLEQAYSLEGATMPDGQKYEDWLKSKGHGEDGENSGPS